MLISMANHLGLSAGCPYIRGVLNLEGHNREVSLDITKHGLWTLDWNLDWTMD